MSAQSVLEQLSQLERDTLAWRALVRTGPPESREAGLKWLKKRGLKPQSDEELQRWHEARKLCQQQRKEMCGA